MCSFRVGIVSDGDEVEDTLNKFCGELDGHRQVRERGYGVFVYASTKAAQPGRCLEVADLAHSCAADELPEDEDMADSAEGTDSSRALLR